MIEAKIPSLLVARLAIALVAGCFGLFEGNSGCAPATVCFRNTDCGVGSDCKQGACVRRTESESDAGIAGGTNDDAGSTGSDMSATSAGATSAAGTSGSAGSATSASSGASAAGASDTGGSSTGGDPSGGGSTGGSSGGGTSGGGTSGGGTAGA